MTSLMMPNVANRLKFFEDFFGDSAPLQSIPCDVVETEKSYVLSLDLPGFDKTKIAIDYQNDVLTISGSREEQSKSSDVIYHLNERKGRNFKRAFAIKGINDNAIEAQFAEGVLTITLPKREEAQAKRITIK